MRFLPSRLFKQVHGWLSRTIPAPGSQGFETLTKTNADYKNILLACLLILITSICVRLLHWQDKKIDLQRKEAVGAALLTGYEREAKRMLEQGAILYPSEPVDPGDARMLVHPPGYSMLLAAFEKTTGDAHTSLRLAQVICDSMAAALVFLIAAELLRFTVSLIAGALVAFSPHLAWYSLWLSADSVAVLPILLSVYLIVRAIKSPRLITIIFAGASVGLSCWVRSNALLLAPFLAVAIFLLFERARRLRYSVAFVAASLLIIAPITVRNLVVFDSFIPLSLGAGITLIEGIADYDTGQRFGMPQYDTDVAIKEAEWHGRPDYAGNLWRPDGVARERARFARGLEVARSNPGWFSTVMLRRCYFMMRYNDSGPGNWPLNTSQAPVVLAEPGFSHQLPAPDALVPVWAASPPELMASGASLSPDANVRLARDDRALEIRGDGSQFGDQFASGLIPVRENTDYVLKLPTNLINPGMAVKVTSADYRITLGSAILEESKKRKRRRGEEDLGSDGDEATTLAALPFASGDRTEVRLVIANNQPASAQPLVELGPPEIVEVGQTAYLWTRGPRALILGVQKNLFRTDRMLPLIIAGVALLALVGHKRALVIILAVPVYYFCTQSALHTEYRYILSIHYLLFIMAAVTIYCMGAIICQTVARLGTRFRRIARRAQGRSL